MAALSSTSSGFSLLSSLPGSADSGVSVAAVVPKRQYSVNMAHLFKGLVTENAKVLVEIGQDRLEALDPIRQVSIIDLADETLNAKLVYTIGVIREISDGKIFHYVVDAGGLEDVFTFSPQNPKNPLTKQPIKEVHYYTLTGKTDSVFEHLTTSFVPRSEDCRKFIQTFLAVNDKDKAVQERAKDLTELCDLYLEGKGCEKSLAKAEECLRKAGDLGDGEALYRLANWYIEGDEQRYEYTLEGQKKALGLFKRAIDLGSSDALYHLMNWCEFPAEEGDDVVFASEDRLKLAFQCYEKGARLKHSHSLYRLGLCYKNNQFVDASADNLKTAFNYFKEAATGGEKLSEARLELGLCYKNNQGVDALPDNLKLAIDQFMAVVEDCHTHEKEWGNGYTLCNEALYQIGCCYYEGHRDPLKALEYYQKAAQRGHLEAGKKVQELALSTTSSSDSSSSSSSSEATSESSTRKRGRSPAKDGEPSLKKQREEGKDSSGI